MPLRLPLQTSVVWGRKVLPNADKNEQERIYADALHGQAQLFNLLIR